MDIEKMSPEFDEWFNAQFWHECYLDVKYIMFIAWKASRESLVIELPTVGPEPEAPEDAIDDSYMDAHHAKISMRNACFKAIDAVGLKVKP